jgi:hypothetical protein
MAFVPLVPDERTPAAQREAPAALEDRLRARLAAVTRGPA